MALLQKIGWGVILAVLFGYDGLICHPSLETFRIACLRSSRANLHVGPGLQYPVDWILTLRHMPVWIVAEHGPWRRVQLCDGTRGWLHKSNLCVKKTAQVKQKSFLLDAPSPHAKKVAKIGEYAIVSLVKRKDGWLKVLVKSSDGDKIIGWIPEDRLWGLR